MGGGARASAAGRAGPGGLCGGCGGGGAALAAPRAVFAVPGGCVQGCVSAPPGRPLAGNLPLFGRKAAEIQPSHAHASPTHSFQPPPVLSGRSGRRAAPSRRGGGRVRCRRPEEKSSRGAGGFAPSLCGRGRVWRRAEAEAVFSLILAELGRADSTPCAHPLLGGGGGGCSPHPAAPTR